ncbi:MAG TPA: hypothetical protein VNQ74_10610, partial [Burkholderiaceae bacterium]|nr:hypothetical protein [Burkholderiaceae bacterium]
LWHLRDACITSGAPYRNGGTNGRNNLEMRRIIVTAATVTGSCFCTLWAFYGVGIVIAAVG